MERDRFVGQVGLGYWGKNIFRNLYELGVLSIACEANRSLIEEFKSHYSEVEYTDSFDRILSDPKVKAVVISTPSVTHYELAKKSLLAGKDVFVEKPLALKVREGEELVDIAKRNERVLMVGHILQYHPAIKELKRLVSSGELGQIQYIYSNRLNVGRLRTEENILWSFAPHDVSVILMLVEEEPEKIFAFGGDYVNRGIYDTTLTGLEFRNGIKAHIFVSWLHPYKEQKFVVVGSKGMAVFDDMTDEKLFIYPHEIEWRDGKTPVAKKADPRVIPVEMKEPLKEEMRHFIECVRERKKPLTDGEEGVRVLKILEGAERSLHLSAAVKLDRKKKYFVHDSSYIDEEVEIGENTKIWHFCHILKGTKIGENCVIGQNVMIGPDVKIGNRCKIQNNVSIYKGVTLEDDVFCGPSCVFTNVYNPRAFIERKHEFKPTLVKKGATIGANATIICGVTIGRYAVIGAGAVVRSDVPDYAVMAGVPARQIGWACKCGRTLNFIHSHALCEYCSSEYRLEEKGLIVIREEI